MTRAFNWAQLWISISRGIQFIPQTLILAFAPFVFSLLLGLLVCLIRIWKVPVIAPLLKAIVTIMKGVPVYLLLVTASLMVTLYFNGIAEKLGWNVRAQNINGITLGVVVISIASIPMMSEALRGAALSVPQSQYEAGYAAGLSRWQITRRVVIPQMIPEAVPLLTNNLVSMVKASALCSLIGVPEVLSASIRAANQRYDLLEGYIAAALVYWGLCFLVEKVMRRIELYTGRFKSIQAS